jgi:hypothetical protein
VAGAVAALPPACTSTMSNDPATTRPSEDFIEGKASEGGELRA